MMSYHKILDCQLHDSIREDFELVTSGDRVDSFDMH